MYNLIEAAVLASNAHNSQPWRFYTNSSMIDVVVNKNRQIKGIDPYFREMYLSIGCAIENMIIALPYNNFQATVTYFPKNTDNIYDEYTHVARIQLSELNDGSNFTIFNLQAMLFDAIPKRHTNRGEYSNSRELPTWFYDNVTDIMSDLLLTSNIDLLWITDEASGKETFAEYEIDATEEIIDDNNNNNNRGILV